MRSTCLEVDITAIKENLQRVRELVNGKKIIAVVKADAYGMGSLAVTKALIEEGLKDFAVGPLEEAETLRKHGVTESILMLSPFMDSEIPDLIGFSVIPTLVDYPRAKALNDFAYKNNLKVPVHVKVDSGMGRLGVDIKNAFPFIEKLLTLRNIKIEGIYSHFPSADLPDETFTRQQITQFNDLVQRCQHLSLSPFISHIANSGGIIAFPDSYFDGVRPGIMLYGAYPSAYTQSQIDLSKVAALKTQVLSIKEINAGDGVSYGRTFIAKKKTKIAILPIGYADGLSTLLSNRGIVSVCGQKVPVIGRVCMDYTMIDVTAISEIDIGEEVTLLGDGITEEDISRRTGLIPYEVLTSISKRVPRIYTY